MKFFMLLFFLPLAYGEARVYEGVARFEGKTLLRSKKHTRFFHREGSRKEQTIVHGLGLWACITTLIDEILVKRGVQFSSALATFPGSLFMINGKNL